MESDPGGLKKRRPRVVLKSRRRGPPSVTGLTNEALEKMIQTRKQLKKEIFGQTFEESSGITSYPTHSTPVRTNGITSYPTHSTPVRTSSGITSYPTHSTPVHTTHHTLQTNLPQNGGLTRYTGAASSASSEYDEPDHQQNFSHFYGQQSQHNQTQSHDNKTQSHDSLMKSHDNQTQSHDSLMKSHDNKTQSHDSLMKSHDNQMQSHDSETQSRDSQARLMLASSEDSSPLHRPVRMPMTNGRRKPKRNEVHPQDDDDTLSEGLSPPPENATSRFITAEFSDQSSMDQNATIPPPRSKKLFSTSDSFASTTLTPLLTSDLRRGGRKPSTKMYFDFDAEGQLQSCFPDRQIQVFIVTWNMQEKKLLPDSLDDLLLPLSQHTAADMFVIGTQESTPSKREWEVLLQQTLGPAYVMVQSASLGIIYLTLYLRRDLIWFCSAAQRSSFATRPGTLIKTKGGVGITFTLFGTSFLFVTSHLTAHTHNVQERNSDVQRITANLSFCSDSSDKGSLLSKCDHVFWLGDLNYRVDTTRSQADQAIADKDWKPILLRDQLTIEMLLGNVFKGFSEQPISFSPSYKFDSNSDTYDSSEKKRVPSWTDRILFKSLNGRGITGSEYSSCASLKISDHRPVHAVFKAELRPSQQLDGVPETIVSFDRNTYSQAQQRRRQLAIAEEQTDGGKQHSEKITSSLCVLF